MKERQSVCRVMAGEYQKARKKEKGSILDRFLKITGYNRCYGSFLLRNQGKRRRIGKLVIVGDITRRTRKKRESKYDQRVVKALTRIWMLMDFICGKRLAPALSEIIPVLEKYGEIRLERETRQKLLSISASSIDRLLTGERKKLELKGRSGTKPGTLLKHQIPIRTFSDWDEGRPGYVEIDLVGHEGGDSRGDYCQTLDVTDVFTGWTETRAVQNKAQIWVFEALKHIREQMPFQILGIDSDNGGEFINKHLLAYCNREQITFTRSRSNRKNDNCFVEQKNYSVVRKAVGYSRFDTAAQLEILNELYSHLRLYTNYFLPVMKLIEKKRVGAKVVKKYDKAQTPFKRVLASPYISKKEKQRMHQEYAGLNPAHLKREISRLQQELYTGIKNRTVKKKRPTKADIRENFAVISHTNLENQSGSVALNFS